MGTGDNLQVCSFLLKATNQTFPISHSSIPLAHFTIPVHWLTPLWPINFENYKLKSLHWNLYVFLPSLIIVVCWAIFSRFSPHYCLKKFVCASFPLPPECVLYIDRDTQATKTEWKEWSNMQSFVISKQYLHYPHSAVYIISHTKRRPPTYRFRPGLYCMSDDVVYRRASPVNVKFYTTRGQSNLTKSASRRAHSPVRGHPRGSNVVPLNSWGRVSY